MALTTVTTLHKTWGRIRAVPTGHFAVYFPGDSTPANTIVVYAPDGSKRGEQAGAVRDYDLSIAENGELVVYSLGFTDGSDDHPVRRWTTGVFVGGALPAPGGGNPMPDPTPPAAPVDLAPLTAAINKLADTQDQMWRDLVGRLKAHDALSNQDAAALAEAIDKLPDAIVGETPAGDHFGLDPRAQFGNRWQELFIYALAMRQDALQVITERFFEAWRNMQAEGFDPATGQYHKP